MRWTQTQPADLPIEYDSMKAFLRLDDDSEQDLVTDLIAAATSYAENAMGRSLMQRTITATFYAWATPLDLTFLPRGPVLSITSVKDVAGNDIPNAILEFSGNSARLRINNGYSVPTNTTVIYEAGYATADAIDAAIRHAIRMHAAQLYLFREPVADGRRIEKVPNSLDEFYRQHSFNVGVG